jgi:hypothetical protein
MGPQYHPSRPSSTGQPKVSLSATTKADFADAKFNPSSSQASALRNHTTLLFQKALREVCSNNNENPSELLQKALSLRITEAPTLKSLLLSSLEKEELLIGLKEKHFRIAVDALLATCFTCETLNAPSQGDRAADKALASLLRVTYDKNFLDSFNQIVSWLSTHDTELVMRRRLIVNLVEWFAATPSFSTDQKKALAGIASYLEQNNGDLWCTSLTVRLLKKVKQNVKSGYDHLVEALCHSATPEAEAALQRLLKLSGVKPITPSNPQSGNRVLRTALCGYMISVFAIHLLPLYAPLKIPLVVYSLFVIDRYLTRHSTKSPSTTRKTPRQSSLSSDPAVNTLREKLQNSLSAIQSRKPWQDEILKSLSANGDTPEVEHHNLLGAPDRPAPAVGHKTST